MTKPSSDEVTFSTFDCYGFAAVCPNAVWFWPPPGLLSVMFACVLVRSALLCSTCVWHYCDKAAQPLWGDGECQRLERRSEQLPNIWWNEKHTRCMAGLLTPQRGSRAKGGGHVKPQKCVWNIVFFSPSPFFFLHVHISSQIPNNSTKHTHNHFYKSISLLSLELSGVPEVRSRAAKEKAIALHILCLFCLLLFLLTFLLPHLHTDIWPFIDPLVFLVPFSSENLLTSHLLYFMVGSVFRSESGTGNSWANLPRCWALF